MRIISYKFVWNGQEMLTKTLVIKDSQGNKIPVSVTYTTSDSPVFDSDEGYKTPSSGVIRNLFVRYAWTDNLKNTVTDKFAEYFIPPNINITNLDALRRVFAGKGTAADRDLLSRSHFIWTRFDIN